MSIRRFLSVGKGCNPLVVDDPRIPLDNNSIERALRGPVVGRKNHYGARSLRGTQVAAHFYTLCETANLVGVDVHAYLQQATRMEDFTISSGLS